MSYGPSKQWAKRETVNKFYSVTKSIHIKGNYSEAMPVVNKLLLFGCFYKEKRRKKQEQWKNGNCSITPFNNKYSQAVLITKEGPRVFIFAFFFLVSIWKAGALKTPEAAGWAPFLQFSLDCWAMVPNLGSPGGFQIQSSASGSFHSLGVGSHSPCHQEFHPSIPNPPWSSSSSSWVLLV